MCDTQDVLPDCTRVKSNRSIYRFPFLPYNIVQYLSKSVKIGSSVSNPFLDKQISLQIDRKIFMCMFHTTLHIIILICHGNYDYRRFWTFGTHRTRVVVDELRVRHATLVSGNIDVQMKRSFSFTSSSI